MKRVGRVLGLGLLILLAASCSIKRSYMTDERAKMAPGYGKALVNFVRPSSMGYAAKATVWDGDKLIGISFGKQGFQYECEPGRHLFIAWSEYKSPVEANLEANRVYYIVLQITPGWWRARIHQIPVNKNNPLWASALKAQQTLPNRTFDKQVLSAAEAEGKAKIQEYLTYYDSRVKGTKHVSYLNPEDGVPIGASN